MGISSLAMGFINMERAAYFLPLHLMRLAYMQVAIICYPFLENGKERKTRVRKNVERVKGAGAVFSGSRGGGSS